MSHPQARLHPTRAATRSRRRPAGLLLAGLAWFVGNLLFSALANVPPVRAAEQSRAKNAPASDEANFEKHIQPFFRKYCLDCHGPDLQYGEMEFQKYDSVKSILGDRKQWEQVFDMLEIGAMPPSDADPLPTEAERKRILSWLERQLFNIDCDLRHDPGRVTIRRLNRAEYDNTVRDLLGIDFHPSAEFPSDDVGEGFDNIGDVLSLSPLLFEKYMDAAEEIAQRTIVADWSSVAPTRRYEGKQLKSSGSANLVGRSEWSMPSRGEVAATYRFRRGGEYVLRARASADQAGPDPARMEFRIDGEIVKVFDIEGHRTPGLYEVQITIEDEGKKQFAAAFINDYYQPKAEDPKLRGDRNLRVEFLEVQGPVDLRPEDIPEIHRRLITCTPGDGKTPRACAAKIIGQFLPRAFRRPVAEEEVAQYVDLVELAMGQGESFERGMQIALSGILVSPHFLFRVEQDQRPDDPSAVHVLSDYELASRLSYFLWSSMPDEELFQLAGEGRLNDPAVLEEQVQRMLADPKSEALVDNFGIQWLNLRMLDEVAPDPKRFPAFNEDLRADMRRETKAFLTAIVQEDRSVLDFLDADFTFVNERLAKLYGLEGIEGDEFRRVELDGTHRFGVLTQASILTITSNPTRTSPVKRGKWIMENILGTPPPPPPDNVPELEEAAKAAPDATLREQLELHRKDPGCAACHRQMDALGFGFENFDAIGRWRERDGKAPIDASGTLPGDIHFSGPQELVEILKQRKSSFCRALTRKMLTYALGRGLEYYDRCAVDKIADALAQHDYRFSALVVEIVKSEPFRKRRGEGEIE